MILYELSDTFRNLFDNLEGAQADPDATPEDVAAYEDAWFEGLCDIEEAFEDKAENIAAWCKELKAEAAALEVEEKALRARRKTKERTAERLKAYLLGEMQAINLLKIDRPKARISIRNNAETAQFEDETAFIEWAKVNADDLLRYADPEIAKTKVKEYLQAGHEIEGVTLGRTQSVLIK